MTLTGGVQTHVGHWKRDDYDVYIGRDEAIDGGTKPSIADTASMANTPIGERGWLGNSYLEEKYGREECIELFHEAFTERLNTDEEFHMAVAAIASDILGRLVPTTRLGRSRLPQ